MKLLEDVTPNSISVINNLAEFLGESLNKIFLISWVIMYKIDYEFVAGGIYQAKDLKTETTTVSTPNWDAAKPTKIPELPKI